MLPETVTGGQLRDAQNKWFLQMDTLKRENVRLQMELDASCNAEELRQVRAENATLRADKERMDWLEQTDWTDTYMNDVLYELIRGHYAGQNYPNGRAAIDVARKKQP